MRTRLENLIDEMLEGHILLDEALSEFEKLYITKALARHKQHLSNTAIVLGIHRNTLAKRVASYKRQDSPQNGTKSGTHKKLKYYSKGA
ncbi:MAG TPA: helix-turn-helix domain-containing protein [Pyrinomonadaceae bacterium]|nr:helix-turn-helix domain-containing protein [Pyrinomonadaceae bacterium]